MSAAPTPPCSMRRRAAALAAAVGLALPLAAAAGRAVRAPGGGGAPDARGGAPAVDLYGYDDRGRAAGDAFDDHDDHDDGGDTGTTVAFKPGDGDHGVDDPHGHAHPHPAFDPAAVAQAPGAPAGPRALFATSPAAVITATVAMTNPFDGPHTFSLEADPAAADGGWALAVGPPQAAVAGAEVRLPVTLSVPIGALDGDATAARLYVRARGNRGARGWIAERTLHAWAGGDMRVDRYVGCRGDLDRSGAVDADDVGRVAARFDARAGEAGYDRALDFDHDGRIGAADVQVVAGRQGRACPPLSRVDSRDLRAAVTREGLRAHLEALQAIADAHDGRRAAGTAGYDASVAYVRGRLEAAGYAVEVRPFSYPGRRTPPPAVFAQQAPNPREYVAGTDHNQGSLSAGGDVTAEVAAVDVVVPAGPAINTSTSGCEAEDFADFPAGRIALVQRGTCPFDDKIGHAERAGAVAVVVFNEGQPERRDLFDVAMRRASAVPVLGASHAVGAALVAELRAGRSVRLRIQTESAVVELPSQSVVAEWPHADGDQVVMLGAHLDSVTAGAGINDDGSGVAAVLETALQVARLDLRPRHRLRFAFWGSEELGLWGSRRYVESLDAAARDALLAYLNFDMIGSPNPIRGRYDSVPEHDGADEIEALFGRWFDGYGAAHEKVTVVTGRSDHAYFSAAGIPIGGLFTGLNQAMSDDQAARYGGTAGAQMDPCYHQRCDTLDNISWPMLDEMADAAAHAAWSLANDPVFPLTSGRARPLAPTLPDGPGLQVVAVDAAPAPAAAPAAAPVAAPRPRAVAGLAQADDGAIDIVAADVRGLAAFEATLRYDPAAIQIVAVEPGDGAPAGAQVLGPAGAAGTLAIGAVSPPAAAITGTHRVATVRYVRRGGPQPPRVTLEAAASGAFDARGVRLAPPAALRLAGALVAAAWLPWAEVGR